MAVAGAAVIVESGKRGIRASGAAALKDGDGTCDECCDPCQQGIDLALAILENVASFDIDGPDPGDCYYGSSTLTFDSVNTERAYYSLGSIELQVEPQCDGSNDIYLSISLINSDGAPFHYGTAAAITVTETTTINDWTWPVALSTDPLYGCPDVPVEPT
jgi:hypothetical protein